VFHKSDLKGHGFSRAAGPYFSRRYSLLKDSAFGWRSGSPLRYVPFF
jgi:hypothetical protein